MTNRVRTELEAAIAADLPDNTTQSITASSLRSACTDLNDTIFREDAIALSDKTGRILLSDGSGYLLRDFTPVLPVYEITGKSIDGPTGNYYERSSLSADSGLLAIVMFVRIAANSDSDALMGFSEQSSSVPKLGAGVGKWDNSAGGNLIGVDLKQTNGAIAFREDAGKNFSEHDIAHSQWFPYCASHDRSNTRSQLYCNDVDMLDGVTPQTGYDNDLDLEGFLAVIGMNVLKTTSVKATFDVSHIWISRQSVDFSDSAVRAKFYDSNMKPVDLGVDGSTPTGVQPDHFAPDGDLANNLGTQSNWTEIGTVPNSSTSPTD